MHRIHILYYIIKVGFKSFEGTKLQFFLDKNKQLICFKQLPFIPSSLISIYIYFFFKKCCSNLH